MGFIRSIDKKALRRHADFHPFLLFDYDFETAAFFSNANNIEGEKSGFGTKWHVATSRQNR